MEILKNYIINIGQLMFSRVCKQTLYSTPVRENPGEKENFETLLKKEKIYWKKYGIINCIVGL